MPTITAVATMTTEERLATEAFRADLLAEFRDVTEHLNDVKGVPALADADRDAVRTIYREIKEVEFCLATDVLPF